MRISSTLLLTLVICVVGCDDQTASTTPSSASPAAPKAPTAPSAPKPLGANGQVEGAEEGDDYERQVAEVGVGKKGRKYGGGIISEPIRAMHRTEQRLQLLQVPQAMNLYKATNDHFPKTHEAFMKDIIEANHIELPELPEGERYVYDPETSELMVERPKK